MKNRKSLLGLGLLALVLVLGVGYAAVNGVELTISGSASTGENRDIAVTFNGTTDTAGDGETIASASPNSLTASISVTGLTKVNDTASATYTIQNKEVDLAAIITEAETDAITVEDAEGNDLSSFFEVTTSLSEGSLTIDKATDENTPSTGDVTIYVKLKKVPTTADEDNATITVKFAAEPTQPAN